MADEVKQERSTVIELLSFTVGKQDYAIDIGSTREIRGWSTPSEMPDAPVNMLGIMNLRGELVPLMNLAERLGVPTQEVNERSVIIVAEIDGKPIGLLVDAVSDILTPSEDDLKPPPETVTSDADLCVRALVLIEETLVRVLELSSLFPARAEVV